MSREPTPPAAPSGLGRFERRSLLGWAALLVGAVPFFLLWLLVQQSWAPLAALDGEVAADLNASVSGTPWLVSVLRVVTDLGGTPVAVLVFVLTTVFLLIRRQHRLVAFVATTGVGLAVLGPLTKAVVDRARPVVESPVVDTPSNASFPSGHSMTALVTWGMVLLLALPSVRRRLRPWLVAAAAAVVVLVGFTRLALGVHFVSDVLAGWALGAGLLAVTTAAFRGWQHEHGERTDGDLDPLDLPPQEGVHPILVRDPALPGGRRTAAALLGAAVAVFAVVTALGLLVTAVLGDTWLARLDRSVTGWFAEHRTAGLTAVMDTVATLSGTPAVIGVAATLAVVAVALTGSARPALFVVVTVVGEVLIYFGSSRLVERMRPEVADLTAGLPTAASWPSGHAAAAAALYGAGAALLLAYTPVRPRWAVLAVPVLIGIAVGVSRIYDAAHYPTDVLAGLLLGGVWAYTCARLLLPRAQEQPLAGLAVSRESR